MQMYLRCTSFIDGKFTVCMHGCVFFTHVLYVCTCIMGLDAHRRCDKNDPYVLCVVTHTDAATLLTCNINHMHCLAGCTQTLQQDAATRMMHTVLCVLMHTDAATRELFTCIVCFDAHRHCDKNCSHLFIESTAPSPSAHSHLLPLLPPPNPPLLPHPPLPRYPSPLLTEGSPHPLP